VGTVPFRKDAPSACMASFGVKISQMKIDYFAWVDWFNPFEIVCSYFFIFFFDSYLGVW